MSNNAVYDKPLTLLTRIATIEESSRNFLLKSPSLLSGIADPLQVYVNHSVTPQKYENYSLMDAAT